MIRIIIVSAQLVLAVQGPFSPMSDGNSTKSTVINWMRGTSEDDTDIKRYPHVFEDEYIKWSQLMLANESFSKGLEVYNVTALSSTPQHIDGCPEFTEEYLERNTELKDRSLSPWEYIINEDNERIPPRIIDTLCRCTGCIEATSRKEDKFNALSTPLSVTIPVITSGKNATIQVHTGCTCAIPEYSFSDSSLKLR